MPLTFRKATPADTPATLALVSSAYRGDHSRAGWTTEADLFTGARIDAAGVAAKISDPRGAVLLAHDPADPDPDALVACCEVVLRPDPAAAATAYFGLFAVDPLRQAGGFGRLTLQRAEDYARDEWGARRMEMNVISTRDELIAWYLRRGYRRLEQTRPFPYDEVPTGSALKNDYYFVVLDKEL
ncbi:hypothetical protein AK830_g7361 [Neonectria ditissima]|uniref:N-acetyltransferase domain-containing protein n=1 Tax=Neonectria ditissima TaxID=78410 RepID=A0A0P7BAD8_9HYPO|nr:hypothetical protein AK830_g7361 [Neonectria ditissima]